MMELSGGDTRDSWILHNMKQNNKTLTLYDTVLMMWCLLHLFQFCKYQNNYLFKYSYNISFFLS